MKRFLSIFTAMALLVGFTACEEGTTNDVPNDQTPSVELKADKLTIVANGQDAVTFEVLVDGTNRTSECQIINLEDNSILEGTTFTATEAGSYRFKAAFGSVTSEIVTIAATKSGDEPDPSPEVVLSADKSEIKADNTDAVTFTVMVEGVDRTAESTITVVNYGTELEGATFVTDVAGEFKFEAEWDGYKSEQVTVTATAVETPVEKKLRLAVDVKSIKADGQEKATFTVTYGEEDVTAKSEIYVENTNEVLEDATFTTTEAGAYYFRARYNDITSPFVSVDAYNPELVGQYEVGAIYDNGTVKGLIFAVKADNHGDTYCYIVSLDEEDLQWSTKYEWCNCLSQRGDYNTYDPFNYFGMNINDYPAFKWCIDHGDGWFMPSSTEVNLLWEMLTDGARDFNAPSVAKYNELIVENGGEPFVETYYWTSNETSDDLVEVIAFMNDSVVCLDPKKDNVYTVRAAYRFKVE